MKQFEEIKALLAEIEPDVIKHFVKGNASAGVRVRKAMQKVKALCQEVRVESFKIKGSNE